MPPRGLAELLAGQAVSLESFAGVIEAMLAEAGRAPYCHLDDVSVGLSALGPLWLAGAIELGPSGRGRLVAARFQPADPEPAGDRPLAVCQANLRRALSAAGEELEPSTPAPARGAPAPDGCGVRRRAARRPQPALAPARRRVKLLDTSVAIDHLRGSRRRSNF